MNAVPYSGLRIPVGQLTCISHQFGSWFSCIAGFREILRFAQNDNLKQCVILRGGLCPEESLRRFEEEELFLADVIAACEKCGLGCSVGVQTARKQSEAVQVISSAECQQIGDEIHVWHPTLDRDKWARAPLEPARSP